eukprot:s1143_g19.t1
MPVGIQRTLEPPKMPGRHQRQWRWWKHLSATWRIGEGPLHELMISEGGQHLPYRTYDLLCCADVSDETDNSGYKAFALSLFLRPKDTGQVVAGWLRSFSETNIKFRNLLQLKPLCVIGYHWPWYTTAGFEQLWGEEERGIYASSLHFNANVSKPIRRFITDVVKEAALPEPWTAWRDDQGRWFFHNRVTGESRWPHPLTPIFKEMDDVVPCQTIRCDTLLVKCLSIPISTKMAVALYTSCQELTNICSQVMPMSVKETCLGHRILERSNEQV